MTDESNPIEHASGAASAPGDLPLSAVLERDALRVRQFRHDNTLDPRAPTPDIPVTVVATSGIAVGIQRAEVWYTTDGTWPDESSSRLEMQIADIEWAVSTGYLRRWEASVPPQPDRTIVRYSIAGYTNGSEKVPSCLAHDGSGFWYRHGEAGLTTFAYRVQEMPRGLPVWMRDAIIYQIFLDRFRTDTVDGQLPKNLDPHAKHGGTLRGVINALPYLADLGVNCLWLSPVGPSATYHRYDQSNFYDVDPDLGGLDAMAELVEAAHGQDMRLILDFVPSHGSWDMPQFKAAQTQKDAPTSSWFVFDEWPDTYRCFLGMVPSLVSFNGNDDGLRQFLIDSATFWLNDVGFDGLRLDHVVGHGSDFWVHFSDALERVRPDVAILGEATDTPEMLKRYRGSLQGILDFPLAQMLRMAFGRGEWDVAELSNRLQAHIRFFEDGPDRAIFFDNHDMNRFLYEAGGDVCRLKLAAICLLTLPFPPVLYYGTEIGMSQEQDKDSIGFGGDHEARRDMVWNPTLWDMDLLAFFKAIIKLRRRHPALRRGHWQPLLADSEKQIYIYRLVHEKESIQVVFNLSDRRQSIPLDLLGGKRTLLATNPTDEIHVDQPLLLDALSGLVAV